MLGVELRRLDAREAAALGLTAGGGLVVTAVDPRGPASGVLEEGDVMLALDGRPVNAARIKGLEARLQQRRARDADHPARPRPLRAAALR